MHRQKARSPKDSIKENNNNNNNNSNNDSNKQQTLKKTLKGGEQWNARTHGKTFVSSSTTTTTDGEGMAAEVAGPTYTDTHQHKHARSQRKKRKRNTTTNNQQQTTTTTKFGKTEREKNQHNGGQTCTWEDAVIYNAVLRHASIRRCVRENSRLDYTGASYYTRSTTKLWYQKSDNFGPLFIGGLKWLYFWYQSFVCRIVRSFSYWKLWYPKFDNFEPLFLGGSKLTGIWYQSLRL